MRLSRWTRHQYRVILAVVAGILMPSTPALLAAQSSYTVVPALAPQHVLQQVTTSNNGDTTHVTLVAHDSTIRWIITTIAHQAHLSPIFNDNSPSLTKRISVNLTNMRAADALAKALQGTGLVAKLASDGETVMIRSAAGAESEKSPQASGVITGRITDSASGKGLTDVLVRVAGSSLSATTSNEGAFIIRDVPTGTQIVTARIFGYRAAERTVTVPTDGPVSLRITLTSIPTVLSGVVTTATGVQQKLAVGSDITTINVDSVMKTAPITSVTDLLENRVPGLTVVHTSGTPGDPSRLLLRGAASVQGNNNPIVVVDGVRIYDPQDLGSVQEQLGGTAGTDLAGQSVLARPSPLDQIDPNTIATIEVLKGPSASALYGSDAANGVIVITTKKGEPGRTHWSISADQGVSYIPGSYPALTYEFGHVVSQPRQEFICPGGQYLTLGPCIIDSVVTFQALNDPRFSPLTSGPFSRASATVSGGASALTYSFTGSASNTHGETKLPVFSSEQYTAAVGSAPPAWMRHPDDYAIWNGSGQVQATLSPTASVTVSDMLSSSAQHRTSLGLSAVRALINQYVDTTDITNIPAYTNFLTQITQATLTSLTNATLHWRIQPWLPLTVTGGYSRDQENDKQYLPAGLPSSILPAGVDSSGFYSLGTQQATVATLNANTTIPVSLGRGPGVQLAAGTNFEIQSTAGQDIATTQVPVGVSDPTTFPQTTATFVSQETQSAATYGWFVEPQLQFHGRMYITPGIRLDGGTTPGNGAGFAVFPKTNFSYIALDRTGASSSSFWSQAVSLLRLRGSLGIAGVQPTPGQSLRLYSTPHVVSLDGGTTTTSSTQVTTIGNTLLHPERSREFEVGFDVQFFQNRATLTATYYDKLRIDAIENVSVASSVFVGTVTGITDAQEAENVGNIRNSGLEMTGTLRLLDRSATTWSVNGTISTNENRVLSVNPLYASYCKNNFNNINNGAIPCVLVGYPLGALFEPSIIGAADINHDGTIEKSTDVFLGDSLVYVGAPDPRYTASFGTTLTAWQGRFSFALNGSYQNGLTVINRLFASLIGSAANQPGATLETLAQAAVLSGTCAQGASCVQSTNVLQLNTLTAGFTLPTAIAHMFRAQQATLLFQGSNLGTWTNFKGKDPLATSTLSGLTAVDAGNLPRPRTWQVSMRITQ